MSKIQFMGQMAGLARPEDAKKKWSGDANSVFDYVVICKCDALIGPLGRFMPNPAGQRTPCCPICKHVTIIEKDGTISNVILLTQEALDKIIRHMAPPQGRA